MAQKFISFGYDTIEGNTGFLFWQVSHIWQLEQDKILKRMLNVSQLHYVILASTYWLHLHDVEVTQSYLSQHTKIEKMTISKNIQILEELGYVFRKCHSSDMRANAIFLTIKGINLLEQAVKIVVKFDHEFFSALGKNLISFNKKLLALIEHNKKNLKTDTAHKEITNKRQV
jgi:DNA-binding MarR family transcriptional regulator